MNQRFQNEEIKLISEQYAENELYKAVNSIGLQLEIELKEFGLCPEECFMETLELLSEIANKGEAILPELENLWLRKENEYRRYNRQVSIDEIRKSVGIVFGFVILAIDSSRHRFYRYTLSEQLTMVVANHKWDGWQATLSQIFSVPLPDGWFDAYIDEEPENDGDMADFAKTVNSLRKHMPNAPLVVQLVQRQYNNCCQQFFAPISNCTIMMPAASQSSKQKAKQTKPKTKADKKSNSKPMTMKYYKHGNKGELKRQRRRVHQVFKMWNRWGWIDQQTAIEDFDAFFEGEPRHCNITWTGSNTTILTIMLQELLKQSYFEEQTGCAAKSLVEQQFGKTANSDRTRLDNISDNRIKLTLLVLDPNNHDLIFQRSDDLSEIQDIQDAALMEIFAGQLHSTKGI